MTSALGRRVRGTRAAALTGPERRALDALVAATLPPSASADEGRVVRAVTGRVESWLAGFEPPARLLVRGMLAGVALAPLARRRPAVLHRLDPSEARAWVARSAAGARVRSDPLQGLQTLISMAHASLPEVQRAIGYDGGPLLPLESTEPPARAPLAVRRYPDLRPGELEADAVVIGSGAGGAVAAETLARSGLAVVVVEEGGLHDRTEFARTSPPEELFSLYRNNGLTFSVGTPTISLPMGRAVGGTTVVNSGTCFRTPGWVLAAWSRQGIPAVSPVEMDPWFDAVESALGVRPVPEALLGRNGELLAAGSAVLGLSGGPIRRNIRGCHGHGRCAFGCPLDAKQAMHVTYLPRAVEAGATILSHTRARQVWTQGGRAVGVVAELLDPVTGAGRGTLRVRARATVVAAGAVYSPALLLRQGLARGSGQLGRNLAVHPGAGITAVFAEPQLAWRGTMQSYQVDERLRDGILLEATFPPPGIGYSTGSLPGWAGAEEVTHQFQHLAACGLLVSDRGRGRVRAIGRRGALVRYDLAPEDVAKVLSGIAMAAEVLLAAGAEEVYPMLPGLRTVRSADEARRIPARRVSPGDLHLSAYHPMGTARMGADPATSVVDPWGAVWDVPGLWVLDASVLPSSTYVNPQITIMALVARCAARLADSLG